MYRSKDKRNYCIMTRKGLSEFNFFSGLKFVAEFLTKHEAIESGDGSGSDNGSGSGNAENVEEGSAWVVDACPAMPTPKPPKGEDVIARTNTGKVICAKVGS